jgi:hypothetical protein
MIYNIYIRRIFNRNWDDTRWQQYITHLHTNNTHNTFILEENTPVVCCKDEYSFSLFWTEIKVSDVVTYMEVVIKWIKISCSSM